VSAQPDATLIEALAIAQRLGVTGEQDLPSAITHARAFVRCLDGVPAGGSVVDLGSGGGLPGIVIAHDRPDLAVTLVERRRSRADLLVRMAGRITAGRAPEAHGVDVTSDDAERLTPPGDGFDAATARAFGPPEATLATAVRLVRRGGVVVISDPPPDAGDRWAPELLARCGVERVTIAGLSARVSCFRLR
jgi:16S rRNA (guanine527-N7)-methyltransferase